jgi:hypothetical protein
MRIRHTFPIAVLCLSSGCFEATVDVPQMCTDGALQFEPAGPVPASSHTPSSGSTLHAATGLDFGGLGALNGAVSPSEVSLRFAPGQLQTITGIVATVQHQGDSRGVEVLRMPMTPAEAQAGDSLTLDGHLDQATLISFVKEGPTVLVYAFSGQLPASGLSVQSHVCVAASAQAKKSLF